MLKLFGISTLIALAVSIASSGGALLLLQLRLGKRSVKRKRSAN